ncbi:MAG: hypothetical protein ACKVPX_03065 [Myxococcaceae bacterium]
MVRLQAEHFQARDACLGWQCAKVVTAIEGEAPGLTWFATDMEVSGTVSLGSLMPSGLRSLGRTADFAAYAMQTTQFLKGVLWALPSAVSSLHLRDGASTEDPAFSEMGNAEWELRLFDTTYIEIYARDCSLLKRIADRFATGVVAAS